MSTSSKHTVSNSKEWNLKLSLAYCFRIRLFKLSTWLSTTCPRKASSATVPHTYTHTNPHQVTACTIPLWGSLLVHWTTFALLPSVSLGLPARSAGHQTRSVPFIHFLASSSSAAASLSRSSFSSCRHFVLPDDDDESRWKARRCLHSLETVVVDSVASSQEWWFWTLLMVTMLLPSAVAAAAWYTYSPTRRWYWGQDYSPVGPRSRKGVGWINEQVGNSSSSVFVHVCGGKCRLHETRIV